MNYVGVLAGGINKVGNENLPIQFSKLGNKPVIIHTIEQFVINAKFEKIIVVVPEIYIEYTTDLFEKYFDLTNIIIIAGGRNKNISINHVVNFLNENYEISEDDLLLCHDAIRPFITQKIINDNLKFAEKYNAINTVVPSVDTVVYSQNGKTIDSIPKTTTVFVEQTPQTFKIAKINEVVSKVETFDLEKEIDIARLFINNGYDVYLLNGEFSNIKLVTGYDLELANTLIKEME